MHRAARLVTLGSLWSLGIAGCGGYDPGAAGGDAGVGGGGPTVQPSSCAPTWEKLDPAALPACCVGDGNAHCVPSAKVPAQASMLLDSCASGGVCIPDTYVRAGGIPIPRACVSLSKAAGVCLSVCIPQVKKNAPLLPQDVCADDEKCVPCISPLDNKPTGACDIGQCKPTTPAPDDGGAPPMCPHVGPPVLDPATLPACGTGGGAHCVTAQLISPAQQALLAACPGGFCAPDSFISTGGRFIPPTCTSVNGAEGRCLDLVIPVVAAQSAQLPQASCTATERCVPCYSPLDGKATGACTLSCDPGPQKPPMPFAACCQQNGAPAGRCVPTTAIPMALQSRLGADTCMQNDLCVPAENLDPAFKPTACTASNFLLGNYTGVCLSDCLQLGLAGIAISVGDCQGPHRCVPCTQNGKPTGAPGCPP